MWHYVLRRTAHLFLNQHCEFITNISERCALSRRQSGPIHCPSAKDGGVGGVPLARRQNMTTIRRATGWPYRRIRLSGALDGPQQKTRLLLLHLQRSGAWPAGPVSSLKADEIHLNFTGVSFLENSFNINKELPILSRSPWPLVVADRAAKGSSLQPRGLGGDKNVRLTTQLRSTTWGEPDTNMTTPAAQHGLAYKQPASQPAGAVQGKQLYGGLHALILLSQRPHWFALHHWRFLQHQSDHSGESQFGHPLSCLVGLSRKCCTQKWLKVQRKRRNWSVVWAGLFLISTNPAQLLMEP